jgi:hypothetical protein
MAVQHRLIDLLIERGYRVAGPILRDNRKPAWQQAKRTSGDISPYRQMLRTARMELVDAAISNLGGNITTFLLICPERS